MAQSKAEQNLDKLAAEILENLQSYWPVNATYMGIHDYDHVFTDYSRGEVKSEIGKLKEFERRLQKYTRVSLSANRKIDLKLLKSNCDVALLQLWKLQYYQKNPNLYLDDAANGIYYILIRDYAPLEQRLDNIVARMNALPVFLKTGEQNLSAPPPLWLNEALANIENVNTYYTEVADDLISRFPDRADEVRIASEKARNALESFHYFLKSLTPGNPGSFAIGKEYFDYLLEHQYFLDYDSDSLIALGETYLAEAQENYDRYVRQLEENKPDTIARFVPHSFSGRDYLDYLQWETNTLRDYFTRADIVTIPDNIGDCTVIETPPFLRGIISSLAYMPAGPFDDATDAYFYIQPLPDPLPEEDRSTYFNRMVNRSFRTGVVHEAFPGHHLQLQIAAMNQSPVRKWQMNNELIEGWALYCEELAHDLGLYDDNPAMYLRVLRGIIFRAARIIVDAKLHNGRFSYDDAVSFMAETLGVSPERMRTEVYRYTTDPGQPMTYLIGKKQIMNLRDAIKAREGEAFNLKSFHDRLLSEGSIPVSLIAAKMLK